MHILNKLCLPVMVITAATIASGQTIHTWTGAGANDNFSNSANWDGVGVPPTNADSRILRFGAESASSPNYTVVLNQSRSIGGAARGQEVGRFEFTSSALTYIFNNTASDPNWVYSIYGTAVGGSAPAGDFMSISNNSGVNQIFNTRIRQQALNNTVVNNIYDAGTGGLTFNRTLEFANNAKDLVLRGSGNISFTNIDNTTGSSAAVVVESTGIVTVSGRIFDVPKIEVRSGTLLMTGTALGDVIADSSNAAKRTNLVMAGGTFALGGDAAQTAQFFGTLTLTADSVIDFGGSGGTIQFADSSGAAWNPDAILTIRNWDGIPTTGGGSDQLIFGTNNSGLTAQQLSQIRFEN